MRTSLEKLETELIAISLRLRRFTVEIASARGGGSGVIWSADGLIITNAHVVRGSRVNVFLDNGKVLKGKLIARDDRRDLAAIQIDEKNLPTPTTIGNEKNLRPGEIVLAMGSPRGLTGTLTVGLIHASLGKKHSQEKLSFTEGEFFELNNFTSLIVADIRLAPGNSGGVLADAGGRVIGINTAIFNGFALAIPSQQVKDFVRAIT